MNNKYISALQKKCNLDMLEQSLQSEKQKIDDFCEIHNIKNYTTRVDGSVDVDAEVDIRSMSLDEIPIKFNSVNGNFSVDNNNLKSLNNSPQIITNGSFFCEQSNIKSLKGGPRWVEIDYLCRANKIQTLEGICKHCEYLDCRQNFIKSLEHINRRIDYVSFINFDRNPIKSNVLGVLLIKGIEGVDFSNSKLNKIVNKYIKRGDRDVIDCASELIDANLDDFALL